MIGLDIGVNQGFSQCEDGSDTSGEKLFKQPRLPEETIPNSITLKVSK
jgi:hypothetical protein